MFVENEKISTRSATYTVHPTSVRDRDSRETCDIDPPPPHPKNSTKTHLQDFSQTHNGTPGESCEPLSTAQVAPAVPSPRPTFSRINDSSLPAIVRPHYKTKLEYLKLRSLGKAVKHIFWESDESWALRSVGRAGTSPQQAMLAEHLC